MTQILKPGQTIPAHAQRSLSSEPAPSTEATTVADVSQSAGLSAQSQFDQTPSFPVEASAHVSQTGLGTVKLQGKLQQAERALQLLMAESAPQTAAKLADTYIQLGTVQAQIEAVLLTALDALDPKTGGGVQQPANAFVSLEGSASELLAKVGAHFATLEPSFGPLVHGGGGWPNQPVAAEADRGDGRPLYHYRNTFKTSEELSASQRTAEYAERVLNFESKGGDFAQIMTFPPGQWDQLEADIRYDYVMLPDGTTRLHPNRNADGSKPIKPGHSLLAGGGPEFHDQPILLAGEMWVIRDSAGDLEKLIVANNSGHFKPSFPDLKNALGPIESLGIAPEKVILFGGPNNLPAILEEMEENCGLNGLVEALPKAPSTLIEEWRQEEPTTPLHLQLQKEP